jgi:putative PEP-CTERM system histidine kinase
MGPTVMLAHAGCAAIYAALSALILVRGRLSATGVLLAAATALTAVWAGSVALYPQDPLGGVPGALDLLRSVAWYVFILHLYRRTVTARGQMTQAFAMMGFVALLVIGVTLLVDRPGPDGGVSLWSAGTAARLGLAVCNILLIENLYQNVSDEAKWYINLPSIGLGALFVFDIVLSADAVLFRQASPTLLAARAVATAIVAPLLAVAAARNRNWKIDIHVSRSAAFHSATLVVAGIFLLGLSAVGEAFRHLGPGWSGVAEISLVFAGVVAIAVMLTSGTARGRLRALVVDNFFSTRFDYRREWLRCIATLSAATGHAPLPSRVIRAVADVVDSPGGILYLRAPGNAAGSAFQWAGAWNMPSAGMPVAAEAALPGALRNGDWVVVLDAATRPPGTPEHAWLAVPLPAGRVDPGGAEHDAGGAGPGGLVLGFILLAPPRAPFRLDREVFDLLRMLGREVATYVSEQRATEVVLQSRQLAEYGKRFAFVAHDIKNVSSQLSLLLSNAERHMANPEFQRDMLTTVRASVQKISALLRRLEATGPEPPASTLLPVDRLAALVDQVGRNRHVAVKLEYDRTGVAVGIGAQAFDAVMTHLLTNAIEATRPRPQDGALPPVRVAVGHEGNRVTVDIVDEGVGMTPEFVRDTLFRPFGTAKRGGTGIGAFQARELLREAGGDLLVISRPGEGTTMRAVLPAVGGA